ncbi:MAG: transcription antitermination factor NusB [Candidatus Marinimicrobia bacterium]|nr:transcription antitermination factor NusB [Candidatus Neomarinimicrobiota bacterium]
MRERRAARELVLQSAYAMELSGDTIAETIEKLINPADLAEDLKPFARNLFSKTMNNRIELDEYIKDKSENWEFSRIAIIDRLILRIAICEFLYFEDIPAKVSISEAIEIAKKFSTNDSGSFVNGILDAILQEFTKLDKIKK